MKLAVEFPNVSYREGSGAVQRLARAIEDIGYDQLDMFDHVVMGFPNERRQAPMYPPKMPILEALMTLSFIASATSRIGLGTEVLVLPQRQPVMVARQIATLDTLSDGRVRLGVGVGWQKAEFDALGEDYTTRGKRMDDAIRLLRACWQDEKIAFTSPHYNLDDIAMEPKPPQGGNLPIWIGGGSKRALRRVGELGDGWLATGMHDEAMVAQAISDIHQHAERTGRDPAAIGLQMMLDVPPRDNAGKTFYSDLDQVARRAVAIKEMGFGWATINATAIFQSGARSVDAIIESLGRIHERLRQELG